VRALVIRAGALGDFVATLPVLDRLAEEAREILLVAPPRYGPIFPRAAAWWHPDGPEATALFRGGGLPARREFDLGVAWTSTAAEVLSSVCREVVAGTPKPAGSIHDHLWQPFVARWGPRDRDPRVVPTASALQDVDRRLQGRTPVVIAPGSGGQRKRWPLERWSAVAAELPDVIWVGGPLEGEEAGWGSPRWDDLDVAGLVALASRCAAWLGPDAGPSHVAAAAGARTGVVFVGATDPATWAPPGSCVWVGDPSPGEIARWARGDGYGRR
jgi:ADP-heptose:LPS heptosyltransferase